MAFLTDFLLGFASKITATMTSKPNTSGVNPETQNAADEKARKEELLEARMKMIRKKNEELVKRQKEIEEDRKNADVYSDMAVKKHPENFVSGVHKDISTPGTGRGRGRGMMLKEMRKETLKAKQWEAKRRENVHKEEEERKRERNTSTSASRFLADDNRVDMSRTTGRNERSWGGASFNKVVNRVQREKEGFASHRHKGNIEMTMSGKERHEYTQWRKEREKIDEERKERQKKAGNWSRTWDQPKVWDSKKKMWAYDNDSDDHGFKSTRRRESENSEDWGSDDRNSGRDFKDRGSDKQGSRHSGGFQQHDDRGIQAGEEWGETSESRIQFEDKEEWGESGATQEEEETDKICENRVSQLEGQSGKNSDNKVTLQQKKELGKTTENRVAQREAEWGESSENRVIPSSVEVGSKATEVPTKSHQQRHGTNSNNLKGDFSSAENKEGNSDTQVMSDVTFHDAPKPQRDIKQRRKEVASAEADPINTDKEVVSGAEVEPSLDEEDLSEYFANKPESSTLGKDVDKKFENHTVGVPDNEVPDDDKQLLEDKGTLKECEHKVHDKEDAASRDVHSTDREQASKDNGTVSHESLAQKAANLSKLSTKVEKKVTFDSEENEQAKESDSQDASSVTIGDIPPTPDFLKYDHSLDWGDIEIEEEDSTQVQPKW